MMYSNKLTIKTFLAFFFFLRILTSFPSLIVKGWKCFKSIRQGALRTRQTFRNPKVFSFFLNCTQVLFSQISTSLLKLNFFSSFSLHIEQIRWISYSVALSAPIFSVFVIQSFPYSLVIFFFAIAIRSSHMSESFAHLSSFISHTYMCVCCR